MLLNSLLFDPSMLMNINVPVSTSVSPTSVVAIESSGPLSIVGLVVSSLTAETASISPLAAIGAFCGYTGPRSGSSAVWPCGRWRQRGHKTLSSQKLLTKQLAWAEWPHSSTVQLSLRASSKQMGHKSASGAGATDGRDFALCFFYCFRVHGEGIPLTAKGFRRAPSSSGFALTTRISFRPSSTDHLVR